MKKLRIVGLLVAGVLVGAFASSWWWSHVLFSQMASKSVEVAFRTAEEAEWLAQLRLNEATNVIKQLENSMNIGVFTLAQWEEVTPMHEKERQARDKWLVPVKVYYESYPASGNEAAVISSLLAKIPGRNPQSTCKSGICRLDDLRQGIVNGNTNSTVK